MTGRPTQPPPPGQGRGRGRGPPPPPPNAVGRGRAGRGSPPSSLAASSVTQPGGRRSPPSPPSSLAVSSVAQSGVQPIRHRTSSPIRNMPPRRGTPLRRPSASVDVPAALPVDDPAESFISASLAQTSFVTPPSDEISDLTPSDEPSVRTGDQSISSTSVDTSAAALGRRLAREGSPKGAARMPYAYSAQGATSMPPQDYRGQQGKAMEISTNYIRLEVMPDMGMYEYEVVFDPTVDNRDDRFRLLNQQIPNIGKTKSFDGVKLYLPKQRDAKENHTFVSINEANGESVKVTLRFKKKCEAGSREVIQQYNVLFNRIFRTLKFSQHRRNWYDAAGAHEIKQYSLQVWPGYVTAVDEYEGGLLIQIDISHRVLRQETVKDFLKNLGTNVTRANIEKQLLGESIVTRYNNKSYRIDDIDWEASPKDSFTNARGETMTYMDYYKNQYGLEIKDPNQPLLINRPKKKAINVEEGTDFKICLIPETCLLTGMTETMRSDFRIMKEVAQFTRMTPEQRWKDMASFCRRIRENPEAKAVLEDWGVRFAGKPLLLNARQLAPERLVFGKGYEETANPKGDWTRAATSKAVLTPVDLEKWAIILPEKNKVAVQAFCKSMCTQAPRMGINIANPKVILLMNDRTETYIKEIRELIDPKLQLVLTVVPQIKSDRYAAIKKLCCIDKPVASQVIVLKNITNEKKMSAVAQKVILQINCKLGGELWAPKTPVAKKMMVVGIDVFHDKTLKGASIAGIVSTLNDSLSRFYSQVAFQSKGQELVDAIQSAFMQSLIKYHEANQFWPEVIVVYRDGVGDGQMDMAQNHEAAQYLSVLHKIRILRTYDDITRQRKEKLVSILPADYDPSFNFIVVQKRINTRIFSMNRERKVENPPPGTVLDHTVTRRCFKDFFLVPQSVTQGTVTPTHYVILNESGPPEKILKPDQIQRLSYCLTHMYYNWPGTVRVPAPCQYAHKLVELVGENLHRAPNMDLNDKLYYL